MKKLLLLLAVVLTAFTASAENYITYTSSNKTREVRIGNPDAFGANIIEHQFSDGQGKIIFDGEVTKIGDQAFYVRNGSTLASIDIPSSVTSIGTRAFSACKDLKSIVIPAGVKEIGSGAFDCLMTRVTSLSTTPPAAAEAFNFREQYFAICKLMVPAEAIEAYRAAEGWKQFTNIGVARVVTPETNPFDPNKLYLLKTARGYIDENKPFATDDIEKAGRFRITLQGGGYYLYNTSCEKYLTTPSYDGNSMNISDKPNDLYDIYPATEEGGREGTWFIEAQSTGHWIMFNGSKTLIMDSWRTPDDGDMWTIVEADNAQADVTFEQGGILYKTLTDNQVQVMPKQEKEGNVTKNLYTGDISIPETVAHEGKTYTVVAIGQDAFYGSSITSVVVPNTVTSLGETSFGHTQSLTTVVLGSSVNSIGAWAFSGCNPIELFSLNVTPPDFSTNYQSFGSYSTTIVKVPYQAVEAYKTDENWRNFKNIVGIDPSAVGTVQSTTTNAQAYNLQGQPVRAGYKGVVIVDGKKFIKR